MAAELDADERTLRRAASQGTIRCHRPGPRRIKLAVGEAEYLADHWPLPFCYHSGMSKQIAVRLPDDLVDFVDEIVDSGTERSRAAVVTRALERERRRELAERDARILARTGPDPELAGLAEYAAGLPRDLA